MAFNNVPVNGWPQLKGLGGEGGVSDYEELSNLPKINSVELKGNKSLSDLGINELNYSADETLTGGVWVDGRPIYKKTIYWAGGVTGDTYINHNIENLSKIIDYEGFCDDSYEVNSHMILPRIASDQYNIGISIYTSTQLLITQPTVFENRLIDYYITLKYVKTATNSKKGGKK